VRTMEGTCLGTREHGPRSQLQAPVLHREMMADLLRGFVAAEWVRTVDLTTLERVQSSQVSDDLRDREDDIIWRVRWQGGWLYIYLLWSFSRRSTATWRSGS